MNAHPRAKVSISKPVAFAFCDRCGFCYNRPDLMWQEDWRGNALQRLGWLVCRECLDVPQPNGRKPMIIGPDPVPVRDPRPGFREQQSNVPSTAIFTLNQSRLDDSSWVLGDAGTGQLPGGFVDDSGAQFVDDSGAQFVSGD